MSDGGTPRFDGGLGRATPAAITFEEARQDALLNFVDDLPMGLTQSAQKVTSLRQPDHLSCFYASLASIATSVHGEVVDLQGLTSRARREGLLVEDGANTGAHSHGQERVAILEHQVEFVQQEMELPIVFIPTDTAHDMASIQAVTRGLDAGNHVVFGFTGNHWVALDGFKRWGRGREAVSWAGMNPAGGRRIENQQTNGRLSPAHMLRRIITGNLPVVVVGEELPPRFSGQTASDRASAQPRFRRAEHSPIPSSPRFRGRRLY
jgi:hypothetical protein